MGGVSVPAPPTRYTTSHSTPHLWWPQASLTLVNIAYSCIQKLYQSYLTTTMQTVLTITCLNCVCVCVWFIFLAPRRKKTCCGSANKYLGGSGGTVLLLILLALAIWLGGILTVCVCVGGGGCAYVHVCMRACVWSESLLLIVVCFYVCACVTLCWLLSKPFTHVSSVINVVILV